MNENLMQLLTSIRNSLESLKRGDSWYVVVLYHSRVPINNLGLKIDFV